MGRAFRGAWLTLRRSGLLLPALLAVAAVTVLSTVVTITSALLGVVCLCVAAAHVGSTYSLGTLRTFLVRQPRRLRLLAGTWLAIAAFALIAAAVATVVAVALAFPVAAAQGVSTSAWTTADGLRALAGGMVEGAAGWLFTRRDVAT